MANISAIELKLGSIIEHGNGLWRVIEREHVKPGKGGAFIQTEIKNIKTGIKTRVKFRSEEKVEKVVLETVEAEFSHTDGNNFIFYKLDSHGEVNSYEQIDISTEIIGENSKFLFGNVKVKLQAVDEQYIGIELPESIILEVIDTPPQIKKSTATQVTKQAKLSNGITISVPSFICVGEKILVRISDETYIERA